MRKEMPLGVAIVGMLASAIAGYAVSDALNARSDSPIPAAQEREVPTAEAGEWIEGPPSIRLAGFEVGQECRPEGTNRPLDPRNCVSPSCEFNQSSARYEFEDGTYCERSKQTEWVNVTLAVLDVDPSSIQPGDVYEYRVSPSDPRPFIRLNDSTSQIKAYAGEIPYQPNYQRHANGLKESFFALYVPGEFSNSVGEQAFRWRLPQE